MSPRLLALVCFFFSGATGLMYEVLWTRFLGGTIGNTHFSITLVVSVFMGGLAVGSYAGGRLADRSRNPLRLYGILVLLVAASCLLVPLAAAAGKPLFRWLYESHDGEPEAPLLLVVRILFCAALVLVPTSFMGATLPALSRYFARRLGSVGGTVGGLYALNTFGAVAGALFTGFAAIPSLGLWGTNLLAVGIDAAIGIAVLAASRREAAGAGAPRAALPEAAANGGALSPGAAGLSPAAIRLAVAAFAATGFANMLLQIAWTKAIVLTIGNSTYAFSLIVSLFILGIALGGGAVSAFVDRLRNPPLVLATAVLLTAACVSSTIPLLGYLPVIGARAFDRVGEPEYGRFLWIQVLLVSAVILPSTVFMGTVFPIVGKIRTLAIERVGSAIGGAYFWNTAGSILGTLAAGFVFIPLFGRVYWTLYLGAAISLAIGLILMHQALPATAQARLTAAGAVAAALVLPHFFLLPHGVLGSESSLWHPSILSQGAYVSATFHTAYTDQNGAVVPAAAYVKRMIDNNRIVSYEEGIHAPVAVVSSPAGALAMRISGKVEASIAPSGGYNNDLPHQILAGHLPMLLHPAPRDVLTLGLGGGVTLGTLTLYPVDSIDSLEISPEVIAAARDYFAAANRGAITNPKVRNVVGDGRNHLEYTRRAYDVITSVPSNPWIAGIGNLFTVEFFRTCRERLREGGIICNWIHKINMREGDFRTVVRTFSEVFPEHAQLWDLDYDCLLIGSNAPLRLDAARLKSLLADPEVARDLEGLRIRSPALFLRHYKLDAAGMRRFAGAGPLNTDSFPVLEFSCPYGLYGHELEAYAALAETDATPLDAAWLSGFGEEELERARHVKVAFHRYQRASSHDTRLKKEFSLVRNKSTVQEHPELLREAEWIVAELTGIAGDLAAAGGDAWVDERTNTLAAGTFSIPARPNLAATVAAWHVSRAKNDADPQRRVRSLEAALPFAAADVETALEVARLGLQLDRIPMVLPVVAAAQERWPAEPRLFLARGVLLRTAGDNDAAVAAFEQGLRVPAQPEVASQLHYDLAYALQNAKQFDGALSHYEEALRLYPAHEQAQKQLKSLQAHLRKLQGAE